MTQFTDSSFVYKFTSYNASHANTAPFPGKLFLVSSFLLNKYWHQLSKDMFPIPHDAYVILTN